MVNSIISMPNAKGLILDIANFNLNSKLPKALERIRHISSGEPEHFPAKHTPINYGRKIQYVELEDVSLILDNRDIKRIQVIVGVS